MLFDGQEKKRLSFPPAHQIAGKETSASVGYILRFLVCFKGSLSKLHQLKCKSIIYENTCRSTLCCVILYNTSGTHYHILTISSSNYMTLYHKI